MMTYRILLPLSCLILMGCTTPRAVEEHHHHYYEADTLAVKAQVDRQLSSWHEEMQSVVSAAVTQQLTQQQQSEHQQETVTELITVTTDSLGRSMRQEQRTITRDITREMQQQEQRLTQEYEARLRVVVDSVSDIWQQRFDSLASHQTSDIDHQSSSTPVGDTRPWYQRWRDNLRILFFGFVAALVLYLTRRLWWPLVKKYAANNSGL